MELYGFLNINKLNTGIEINTLSNENWILKSVLYASYNCVLVIPILVTLNDTIKNKDNIRLISILIVLIMAILLITVFVLLANVGISHVEMPAVYAIEKTYPKLRWIYGTIILVSIFTTAISLGISFLKNVSNEKNYKKISIIICLTSVLFSKIGFANLVNKLYPLMGIIGMIQIVQILIKTKK